VLIDCLSLRELKLMQGWRKLLNENLHNSYTSRNIVRMRELRIRWVGLESTW